MFGTVPINLVLACLSVEYLHSIRLHLASHTGTQSRQSVTTQSQTPRGKQHASSEFSCSLLPFQTSKQNTRNTNTTVLPPRMPDAPHSPGPVPALHDCMHSALAAASVRCATKRAGAGTSLHPHIPPALQCTPCPPGSLFLATGFTGVKCPVNSCIIPTKLLPPAPLNATHVMGVWRTSVAPCILQVTANTLLAHLAPSVTQTLQIQDARNFIST